jgi:hypothetical protein
MTCLMNKPENGKMTSGRLADDLASQVAEAVGLAERRISLHDQILPLDKAEPCTSGDHCSSFPRAVRWDGKWRAVLRRATEGWSARWLAKQSSALPWPPFPR